MELITIQVSRDCDIYDAGDAHLGSAMCHEKGIQKMVSNLTSNKNNRLIWKGDSIEGILVTDKRYMLDAVKATIIDSQVTDFSDLFMPAAKQIAVAMIGNHELVLWNYANITKNIIKNLNAKIAYGGYACVITFVDKKGNQLFKMYATHGRRALNNTNPDKLKRKAFLLGRLKAQLQEKASDCLVMTKGHVHKLLIREPMRDLYLTSNGTEQHQHYTVPDMRSGEFIHEESRWYVSSGSFLKTNIVGAIGYAEAFEFDPVELGYIRMEVRGGKLVNIVKEMI